MPASHQSAFLLAASKRCGASPRFLFPANPAQALHLYTSAAISGLLGKPSALAQENRARPHPDASAPCQLSRRGREDAPGGAGANRRLTAARWVPMQEMGFADAEPSEQARRLGSAVTRSPAAAWKATADVQHCHGSQASPCLTLFPSYILEASSAQSKPELEKLRASSVVWDGFSIHTTSIHFHQSTQTPKIHPWARSKTRGLYQPLHGQAASTGRAGIRQQKPTLALAGSRDRHKPPPHSAPFW